jgi:hypothetical protein
MEVLVLTPNKMRTHLEFTTTVTSDKLWMLVTNPKVLVSLRKIMIELVMQIGNLTWSRSAAWCSFVD